MAKHSPMNRESPKCVSTESSRSKSVMHNGADGKFVDFNYAEIKKQVMRDLLHRQEVSQESVNLHRNWRKSKKARGMLVKL